MSSDQERMAIRPPISARSFSWRGSALAFLILGGGALISVILLLSGETVRPRESVERSWLVSAVPAQYVDAQPRLQLFGAIVPGQEIVLRALVQGEIVETWPALREGAIVRKGQPLLRIDPFSYEMSLRESKSSLEEARARLKEMEARERLDKNKLTRSKEQLDIRRRDLERSRLLAKDGNISEQALDNRRLAFSQQALTFEQAEREMEIQSARLQQQRAVVERAEALVSRRQRDHDNILLLAPFDGFLRDVRAGLGRLVSSNDPVATIINADRLEVRFNLSEREYGRIFASGQTLKGRNIQVLWRIGQETIAFNAEIARIGAQISSRTGGVDIFAILDVPTIETPIRPGAFVEVYLPDKLYKNVIRVPETALHEAGTRVYLLNEESRLQGAEVRVAGRDGAYALLESASIKEGARILTTRFPEIGDGVKVREVKENPS